MPCENIVITIEETNEIIEIIINDFSVSNILSEDVGNTAVLGTDGKVFVPESGGVENHSELNLDDGTNPHGTTKSNVGLGNVDNTSDLNKPVSTAQQTALDLKENSVNKVTSIVGNETSNVFFATVKAIYDWAIGLFVPQSRTLTIGGVTQDLSANRTFSMSAINQKNYYEIAKSSIKKYANVYDGSILYKKFGNIVSALVPITTTKFMYVDFLKDAKDDFIKLGEVGFCDIIEQEVYTEKINGTLTGTFNTASYNSFTTQVGATIVATFTGASIYLNYYSDNRGGIWKFTLNTGETINLSTWESVGTSKITKIFDVSYGTYTITATFMGADPLNAPSGGSARGWFVYNTTNPLYKTFSIYDFGFNTSNKTLVLNGSSNKEFAITVKRVGTLDAEQWIPQHTTFGTVYGTSSFLIDNTDFTSLPNRAIYLGCDAIELLQDMQAKNPTDSVYLANVLTSHLITEKGLVFNGTIEFIEPTYSTSGYVCMLPVNTATFGTKLLDSFGNAYDILISDNSDTISPEKDGLISLGVIDNNEDYFLGVDYLGSDETFLKGIGNYKTFTNGMISRFWVQHRDINLNKFYAQTYSSQTIPDNFTHHFNFRMMIGNMKNAYRQLQKENISN